MKNDKTTPEGFKTIELGPLPEEWEIVKLGNVFEFSRKRRSLDINKYNQIPFIPMEYISDEEIYATKNDLVNIEEIKSGTFFLRGDLLVAKITPSFENGKQCIVKDLPTAFGYATTEVWPIHGTDKTNILYLFYYLKKHDVRTNIAGKMEGSTGRQRVPKNILENLNIPLPSLPEQKKIATVLSAVQEAKEKTETVIQAARELKKSLMKHLFTYGPVPLEEAENVPLQETEIGLMPEGWEIVRLGDIAETYSGGTPRRDKTEYWGGSIPWIKSGELNDERIFASVEYITEEGFKNSSAKFVEENTLLIAMYGATAGKVGLAESRFTMNQAICAIVPNDRIYSEFYFYYLMRIRDKLLAERFGGAQPNLNQQIIKNLKILLPPLPIQKKIAEILSAMDRKIESEENKKKALGELFKTLLNQLMTGKLRVNNLDFGVDDER